MIPEFICRVNGIPEPQGSATAFVVAGKGGAKPRAVVTSANKKLGPWRHDMVEAFQAATGPHFAARVPVMSILVFIMPRLKNMPKAYIYPTVRPDKDKLERAVNDALTISGVIADDAQIVISDTRKRYARVGELPGLHLILKALEGPNGK